MTFIFHRLVQHGRRRALASLLAMALPCAATAACPPLRFGYTDQPVWPYYAGRGTREATPPGAVLDMLREAMASAGCTLLPVRMPPARLMRGIGEGQFDATPLYAPPPDGAASAAAPAIAQAIAQAIVFPRDRNGQIDPARGMRLHTVVVVRADEAVTPATEPMAYLRGRRVGLTRGGPYTEPLRQQGLLIDDGAANARANLEKLRLGRIDGFVVSLASPHDLDGLLASEYPGAFVRIEKPLMINRVWLAISKAYYDDNRAAVEAVWDWIGSHGQTRLAALIRKYDEMPESGAR